MTVAQTIEEVFTPSMRYLADSSLSYSEKRNALYTLYAMVSSLEHDYTLNPDRALFECGVCFLIKPETHPDYETRKELFTDDTSPDGDYYVKDGVKFIKFDVGSALYERVKDRLSTPDRMPAQLLNPCDLVFYMCENEPELQPKWLAYYFYLAPFINPQDNETVTKLSALIKTKSNYLKAMDLLGSSLVGDEVELEGDNQLLSFYGDFITYRLEHIDELFSQKINKGDYAFVAEYSSRMLNYYPTRTAFMRFNIASRVELAAKNHDIKEVSEIINDCEQFLQTAKSPAISKYKELSESLLAQFKDKEN